MKVAIYSRVSTTSQTLEPQTVELERYAQSHGWTITHRLSDVMSGAKITRAGLDEMMALVKSRQIEAVLVVKIDRLARSLTHFAQIIDVFRKNNVALVATSQNIDTSNSNPAGKMMLNMLGVIADFEREIISERTKAGLVIARMNGKVLGKPSLLLPTNHREITAKWFDDSGGGWGIRGLVKLLNGVSLSTAARLANEERARRQQAMKGSAAR